MFGPINQYTAGTHVVGESRRFLRGDTTGGEVRFQLPAGGEGASYLAKKLDSSTNAVVLEAPGGFTIDGLSEISLTGTGQTLWVVRTADGNYDIVTGGAGGLSVGRDIDYANLASNDAVGSGVADVTGMTLSIVLDVAGKVVIGVTGIFFRTLGHIGTALIARINSTDYTIAESNSVNGSGGDVTSEQMLSGSRGFFLAAGTYTIKMRASANPSGSTLLAGASLIVDYPSLNGVTGVVGASPTGPAGGDLGSTYPDPFVIGIQGDALPTPVAGAFIRRNAGNTGWELVYYDTTINSICQGNDSRLSNSRTPTAHATSHKIGGTDVIKLDEFGTPTDITNLNSTNAYHGLMPKLLDVTNKIMRADGAWALQSAFPVDQFGTPGDITNLNVSTTTHGLAPKLPNDVTKYLDGTGVYSVPPGSGGSVTLADVRLWKSWFTDNSRMPTTTIKEALSIMPADDYHNFNSGTLTRTKGQIKFVPANTHSNWGWALGASYNKALIIIQGIRARSFNFGVTLGVTQPSTNHPPDGYMALWQPSSAFFTLIENTGGTAEGTLQTNTDFGYSDATSEKMYGLALYCDGTNHIQELYAWCGTGGPLMLCSGTDVTGTTFNSAGFFVGTQSNAPVFATVGLGIYASN